MLEPIGDAGVYAYCKLSKLMENSKLHISPSEVIQGIEQPIPYTIVADDAFPLGPYIMKPFKGKNLTEREDMFNYRLSRARRVVENAFGILANRFRIFRAPILLSPSKAKHVVLATVVLHNMLRIRNATDSCSNIVEPINLTDTFTNCTENRSVTDSAGAFENLGQYKGRIAADAKKVRQYFSDYFSGSGAVPWQGMATGHQQQHLTTN